MARNNWHGDDLARRYHRAAEIGLARGIALIEAEAVRLIMNGPKTGEVYTTMFFTVGSGSGRHVVSYGSRPAHQASAPGEPPANDTSFLVNNRTVTIDPDQLRAQLAFHAAYAAYLEYGTDRIEPRPFARPALVNTWQAVVAAITEEMRRPPQ